MPHRPPESPIPPFPFPPANICMPSMGRRMTRRGTERLAVALIAEPRPAGLWRTWTRAPVRLEIAAKLHELAPALAGRYCFCGGVFHCNKAWLSRGNHWCRMPLRSRNAVSVHLRRETFFAICSYKDALRGFRAARKASLKASLGRAGLTSPSRNQPLSISQGRRPGSRFFHPATSSICGGHSKPTLPVPAPV